MTIYFIVFFHKKGIYFSFWCVKKHKKAVKSNQSENKIFFKRITNTHWLVRNHPIFDVSL